MSMLAQHCTNMIAVDLLYMHLNMDCQSPGTTVRETFFNFGWLKMLRTSFAMNMMDMHLDMDCHTLWYNRVQCLSYKVGSILYRCILDAYDGYDSGYGLSDSHYRLGVC